MILRLVTLNNVEDDKVVPLASRCYLLGRGCKGQEVAPPKQMCYLGRAGLMEELG